MLLENELQKEEGAAYLQTGGGGDIYYTSEFRKSNDSALVDKETHDPSWC